MPERTIERWSWFNLPRNPLRRNPGLPAIHFFDQLSEIESSRTVRELPSECFGQPTHVSRRAKPCSCVQKISGLQYLAGYKSRGAVGNQLGINIHLWALSKNSLQSGVDSGYRASPFRGEIFVFQCECHNPAEPIGFLPGYGVLMECSPL